MTFDGRQPSVEDKIRWKRPSVETTFGGRRPAVEDDLRWKTTFSGRRPVVEDDLQWKTTFAGSLHAAYSALRDFLTIHWNLVDSNIKMETY